MLVLSSEAYWELLSASKIKLFSKMFSDLKPLTISLKRSILKVWWGSRYASFLNSSLTKKQPLSVETTQLLDFFPVQLFCAQFPFEFFADSQSRSWIFQSFNFRCLNSTDNYEAIIVQSIYKVEPYHTKLS